MLSFYSISILYLWVVHKWSFLTGVCQQEKEHVGRAKKVEWGHQVGNLWTSFWCHPCVCFHKLNPRRHIRRANTRTKKKHFQPSTSKAGASQTWHVDNILRTNWQMPEGFDGRVLGGGGALIRMCCSYCVFLSALSSVLPKTYKPGLQGRSVRGHERKQCFKNSAAEIEQTCKSRIQQRPLHRSDRRLMYFFLPPFPPSLLLPPTQPEGGKKKKNWDTLRVCMAHWQLFNHEIYRVMVGLITAEIDPRKSGAD